MVAKISALGGKKINKIKSITARQILDSRGDPTIEVKVELTGKIIATAAIPSGASTGKTEAIELRDGDATKYGGKGVLKACENVNKIIAKSLKGMDVFAQEEIDKRMIELDGTDNKARLGANAILGVSLACARAASKAAKLPLYEYLAKTYSLPAANYSLPTPLFNIFNGGSHADTNLDIQEIIITPTADIPFYEKIRYGAEVFHELKNVLSQHNLDTDVGNEGGYAPDIQSTTMAFDLIMEAIKRKGYIPGKDISLAIDAGANSFYDEKENQYVFKAEKVSLTGERLISLYMEWIGKYPLISIEDPLNETDWQGWQAAHQRLRTAKGDLMVITDDLTVTNPIRTERAIKMSAGNAIIIKLNQIGSLTETIETVKIARAAGWKIVVSHRSGETCDSFISDLAVAVGADFIKAGSLSRSERLAKYNRLMEIEEELGKN